MLTCQKKKKIINADILSLIQNLQRLIICTNNRKGGLCVRCFSLLDNVLFRWIWPHGKALWMHVIGGNMGKKNWNL